MEKNWRVKSSFLPPHFRAVLKRRVLAHLGGDVLIRANNEKNTSPHTPATQKKLEWQS